METTQTVALVAHTLIAILLIVLVLLQRGKGADAGAAFGAGLRRTTVVSALAAAVFFYGSRNFLLTSVYLVGL